MSQPRPSGSSGLPRRVSRPPISTPIGQFTTRPPDTSQARPQRPQASPPGLSSSLASQHAPHPSRIDLAHGSDRRSVGSRRSHYEEVAPPSAVVRTPSPRSVHPPLHDIVHPVPFDHMLRQTSGLEGLPRRSSPVEEHSSTVSSRLSTERRTRRADKQPQGFTRSSPAPDQDATDRRIADYAARGLAKIQQRIEATGEAGVYEMRDILEGMVREAVMQASQSSRSSQDVVPQSQPDTLDAAVNQLNRSRQADETDSQYRRRESARQRSVHPVPVAEMSIIPPAGVNLLPPVEDAVPAPAGNVYSDRLPRVLSFQDRVNVQKMRNGDIRDYGTSRLSDQGIRFDYMGFPFDATAAPNTSKIQFDTQYQNEPTRGQPPDSPSGGSRGSNHSGPNQRSVSKMSPHRVHRDRSGVRDFSTAVVGDTLQVPRIEDVERGRQRLADRRSRAHSIDIMEYRDVGRPQTSAYLQNIHRMYCDIIDDHLQAQIDLPNADGKPISLRIPSPKEYSGDEDVEKFESWLYSVVRYMKMMQLGGDHNDQLRVSLVGMYMSERARIWYSDNVESPYRSRFTWSFKDIILGLYDRFIHEASTRDATEKFYSVKYSAADGIRGFYDQLERNASRMVHAPDSYTFKNQLMVGLPFRMRKFIVERGVTAETSRLKDILRVGYTFEESEKVNRRYDDWPKVHVREERSQPKPDDRQKRVKISSRVRDSGHRDGVRHEHKSREQLHSSQRHLDRGQLRSKEKDNPRPSGLASSKPKPDDNQSDLTCYRCGHKGHIASNPICPKYSSKPAVRMFATRTVVDDRSGDELVVKSTAGSVHSEKEEEAPFGGSQYSSDGAETDLQSCYEYESTHGDNSDGIRAMTEVGDEPPPSKRIAARARASKRFWSTDQLGRVEITAA
jgi:hypothetical protein